MTVKIAVIGGGSSMFVPGLGRRLVDLPCFEGAELRLMDIDAARLDTMHVLSSHLAGSSGRQLSVVEEPAIRNTLRGRPKSGGPIAVVVKLAENRAGKLADLDRDAIRLSFDTKVIGPLMLAKHFAARINEHGSIVIFAGVASAKIAIAPWDWLARA